MSERLWQPGRLRPMLPETAGAPFDSERHLFEPKWDGFRCLVFVDAGSFPGRGYLVQSRSGRDLTARFPELAGLGATGWRRTILDGELVAFRGGRPNFYALQRRAGLPAAGTGTAAVALVVFDLLLDAGEDVTGLPLIARRERLARRLVGVKAPVVLCEAFAARGRQLYELAVARGLEGVVAKEAAGPYLPGRRSSLWLKVRRRAELDCVVGGVAPGAGVGGFGSLLVGAYRDPGARERGEPLIYLGHVGTGFDAAEVARILERLRARAACPFASVPERHRGAVWVEPDVVCRVEYQEFTPDGRLRHPVYRGRRDDKAPGECVAPPIGGGEP